MQQKAPQKLVGGQRHQLSAGVRQTSPTTCFAGLLTQCRGFALSACQTLSLASSDLLIAVHYFDSSVEISVSALKASFIGVLKRLTPPPASAAHFQCADLCANSMHFNRSVHFEISL
jgi:hypothetical protein